MWNVFFSGEPVRIARFQPAIVVLDDVADAREVPLTLVPKIKAAIASITRFFLPELVRDQVEKKSALKINTNILTWPFFLWTVSRDVVIILSSSRVLETAHKSDI